MHINYGTALETESHYINQVIQLTLYKCFWKLSRPSAMAWQSCYTEGGGSNLVPAMWATRVYDTYTEKLVKSIKNICI